MSLALVTGATGKTGGALIDHLHAGGRPVRAFVRRRDERSDALERRGIDVRVGDLTDIESLTSALEGTTSVYLAPPFMHQAYRPAETLAAAMQRSGPRHVVLLSQWLASERHPSPMTRDCWRSEHLLRVATNGRFTVLEPGMFADNFLKGLVWAQATGLFLHAIPGGRSAPVSNEDIAAVAAAILANPSAHEGKRYRPSGPDLMGASEMANAIGLAMNRRIRAIKTPWWLFDRSASALGVSPIELANFRLYMVEHSLGAFEIGHGRDASAVRLLGRSPETFGDIVTRVLKSIETTMPTSERWRQLAILGYAPFASPSGLRINDSLESEQLWVGQSSDWRKGHDPRYA